MNKRTLILSTDLVCVHHGVTEVLESFVAKTSKCQRVNPKGIVINPVGEVAIHTKFQFEPIRL